jgi:hypothetical protein
MNLFLDFIDKIKKIGLEYFDRYYSVYPGIVMDNVDPEKRGRIRVSLPTIFGDGIPIVGWVNPSDSLLAGPATGVFFPPYKDQMVDIIFENGDINFPRYLGGFWAIGELPPEFSYTAEGPMVRGFVFKSGQKILIDETTGALKISVINKDAKVVITEDNIDISTKTLVTVKADKVVCDAKDVVLGADALSVCIGEQIEAYLAQLTVPTVMGPSGPPIVPPATWNASPSKSFKSTHVKLIGN